MAPRLPLFAAALLLLAPFLAPAGDLRIIYNAKINSKPARFIFDTGASTTIILRGSAVRLGVKIVPLKKKGPEPGRIDVDETSEVAITGGGSSVLRTLKVMDAPPAVARALKVDGFLSWRDIDGDNLLLDASRLTFSTFPVPPNVSTWTRWDIVKNAFDVLMIERTDDGRTVRIGIDSGDPNGVLLSKTNWKQWRAAHAEQPATIDPGWGTDGYYQREVVRASQMDLGKLSLPDVPVTPMKGDSEVVYEKCDAVIGLFALTRVRIFFDYKNHAAYTSPVSFPTQTYDYNRLGVSFDYDEKLDGSVAHVMKGSPAEEAGITGDDVLLKMDGTDKWKTDPDSDTAAVFSHPPGTSVKLLLKRGKVTHEVTVTLRELGETAWLPAPAQDDPDLKGNAAYDDDKYDEAIACFTKLIESSPGNSRGYFLRGRARVANKDFDGALADLDKAAGLKPANLAECLYNRSLAWAGKEETDKAIADCTEAIRLMPGFSDAYFQRAFVYNNAGRTADALADYTATIRLDPGDAAAYYNRSLIYSGNGDADAAIADADLSVMLNSSDPAALSSRGIINESLGKWFPAISDYLGAIRLMENGVPGSKPEAAGTYLDLAGLLATCPDASARDPRKAVEFAATGAALDGWQDSRCWSVMGLAFAAAGKFDEAIKFENKFAELADLTTGEISLSHERLVSYRLKKPFLMPVQKTFSIENKAWLDNEAHDYQSALANYNKILDLDPASAYAYSERGGVYSGMGDYEKAIADQKKSVEIDPAYYSSHNELAWIFATCPDGHFRNGVQALEEAKKAVELSRQKNPAELDTLAAAYAETGDFQQAIQWETTYLAFPRLPAEKIEPAKARLALYQQKKPYRTDPKK